MTQIAVAVLGVMCALFILAFGKWRAAPRHNRLADRLVAYETSGAEPESGMSEDIMNRSLKTRFGITFLAGFGRLLTKFTRGSGMEGRRELIEKADLGRTVTPESLLSLEVFSTVVTGAAAAGLAVLAQLSLPISIFVMLVGLLAGARLPAAVIARMAGRRVERIESQLPDALDLLTVSVEAGLTIEAALRKFVQTVDNDLCVELRRVLAEHDLGGNLFTALRHRADEARIPSLQVVSRALIQSSKMGTSLGQLLRIQAEQVRRDRRARAQERAQKAPVKMLLPMVGCIFPTIFAVLLGPAVVNLVVNH